MSRVVLKNIKFLESMSEETNCFTANVYFDGKLVATARNHGHGGNTDVLRDSKCGVVLFKEFEDYCKSLPPYVNGDFTLPSDSEMVVDDLFEKWLELKEEKKLLANMKKGLLFGSKDHYSMVSWKGVTLEVLINQNNPNMMARIKQIIKENVAKGKPLLNTNLPKEVYEN